MEDNQFSRTALLTAIYRGYHSMNDANKIFDDFVAYRLLKEDEYTSFQQQMVNTMKSFDPEFAASFPDESGIMAFMMQSIAVTPLVLSRASYAEDQLEKLMRQGVKQYVILGAGMDTFAFRKPEMLEHLEVFEVDHPDTQEFKLRRLAEAGLKAPAKLHFIPIDFTKESLATVLTQSSSYDPQALSCFSWLGVTYYLPHNSVLNTFRSIADIAPKGSAVIFDYLENDAFNRQTAAQRVQLLLGLAKEEDEPMQAGFDPAILAIELAEIGLFLKEDLGPLDIQQRYFEGRKDRYYACEHAHLVNAIVKKEA